MAEKIKSEIIHIDLTGASYKGIPAYINPIERNNIYGCRLQVKKERSFSFI